HPETLLGTMFKDSNKDLLDPINGNEYFFDRNGEAFHYIMEWYQLKYELDYFQIPLRNINIEYGIEEASDTLDKFIIAMENIIKLHIKNYISDFTIRFNENYQINYISNFDNDQTIQPLTQQTHQPRHIQPEKQLNHSTNNLHQRKFNLSIEELLPFEASGYQILILMGANLQEHFEDLFKAIKLTWFNGDYKIEDSGSGKIISGIELQISFKLEPELIIKNSQLFKYKPSITDR
ncbi:17194_t:CDS:2, partial [Entrophospora sp. SA101]